MQGKGLLYYESMWHWCGMDETFNHNLGHIVWQWQFIKIWDLFLDFSVRAFFLVVEKRNMSAVIENSVQLLVQNLNQGTMKVCCRLSQSQWSLSGVSVAAITAVRAYQSADITYYLWHQLCPVYRDIILLFNPPIPIDPHSLLFSRDADLFVLLVMLLSSVFKCTRNPFVNC